MKNKFGLIGHKLSHSISDKLHNYLYKIKKLNFTYELIELELEQLETIINDLKKGIYAGLNVTIPYKEEIMKFVDVLDETALKVGSVNTLLYKDNLVYGYNTDYYGYSSLLTSYNINISNKECYILGSGGSSKAVISVIKDLGGIVNIVSRNPSKQMIGYDELYNKKIEVIINTTPVGMYPLINASPLCLEIAKKAEVISDLIYNPAITQLMTYNKNSYNGLLMLVYQGVKAFEIWTNIKITEKEINDLTTYLKEAI